MKKADLEARTKEFALRIIRFVSEFRKDKIGDVIGRQLLKSGTSIGANYREANRAESRSDFIHKVAIVEKEAAETQYWLDLCEGAKLGNGSDLEWLKDESGQLLAIFTSMGKTAKENLRNSKLSPRN